MDHFRRVIGAICLVALPAATSAMDTAADDAAPRPKFQNNYIAFEPKNLLALLKWRADAARAGLPRPPAAPTPQVAVDLAFLHANAKAGTAMQPAATWIGHATVLAQF